MLGAALQSQDIPARPVDAVFVAAVIVVGAWTVLVRLAPRLALIGATVSFFVALALHVPAFSPALALGIPLFAVNSAGLSVRGMTERVGALGGDLVAGPVGNGEPGFGVRAWLPGRAR